ncbi:LysR family transcriptional regulator [Rhodococcus sp. NPDC127528]|uniref:LysR family transcriptional regulator n=1 Tax=unclassified Rhodococcus (in: high G+C Gram-positive bacteria) TaxID=192944 RepID=UPI00362FA14F
MSGAPGELEARHLRYFAAVAEELSFTRAAGRLHMAQQSLSAQIKQLEQILGVPLLVRTTRSVRLTAAGEDFLQDARSILSAMSAAAEHARSTHRRACDRLVLGFMEGAALTLTEPILSAFRARHPHVTVEMRQFNYDDPSAGLAQEAVDVAILRRPIGTPGICFERLFAEPVVAALPQGNRLAGRESVQVGELLAEPILGSACADRTWNAFWELDAHRDGEPANVVSRSTTVLEELQKVSAGVGFVVTGAAARWLDYPGVRLVPITDAAPSEVAVGWRRDRESALVRGFVEVARDVREEHGAVVARLCAPDLAERTISAPLPDWQAQPVSAL